MTEKMNIRYAKEKDYQAIENMMKEVQQLHINWRPDIYRPAEEVLKEEEYHLLCKEKLALVAEVQDQNIRSQKIIGVVLLEVREVRSSTQVHREVLFIDAMAVDKDWQRKGIGHQFFDVLRGIVKEKKYDGLELQVNARNKAAYEMYKNYGFKEKSINMEL